MQVNFLEWIPGEFPNVPNAVEVFYGKKVIRPCFLTVLRLTSANGVKPINIIVISVC